MKAKMRAQIFWNEYQDCECEEEQSKCVHKFGSEFFRDLDRLIFNRGGSSLAIKGAIREMEQHWQATCRRVEKLAGRPILRPEGFKDLMDKILAKENKS